MNVPVFARRALLMLVSAATPGLAQERQPATPGPVAELSVIVGRPSDQAVTLSVMAAAALEVQVEYAEAPAGAPARTPVQSCLAGRPVEFELAALKPDQRYSYRLLTRRPGAPEFSAQPAASFQTQRRPGERFVFGVQGDSHPERVGKMYDPALYAVTLRNVAQAAPDFYFMLGDDFSIERQIARPPVTPEIIADVYRHQRGFVGVVGASAALYLVNGNHEQAARANLHGSAANAALYAGAARTQFFPLPAPDGFYSGDRELVDGVGLLRDYYAWTWGDALFVVIDFYWHSPVTVDNAAGAREGHGADGRDGRGGGGGGKSGKNRDLWQVTLGDAQYRWFEQTLAQSKARWKFVFCHHVLGTGRGGIEAAGGYEWGGRDRAGHAGFAAQRPGWALPIHDLMVRHGVTIFFQGHDHLYAHQVLDGVVYQECPNPADPTYTAFNRDTYRAGDIYPNSGYLRVAVGPDHVTVDYVGSVRPADESASRRNGAVIHHYAIDRPPTGGASP